MEISITTNSMFTIFFLKGRLDLNSSSQLKEKVKEHLSTGKINVILSLNEVDFINSSGLGTLVSILKEVRMTKGRVALCCLAPYVQEIFEITQLSHIFDIYLTESEAQASFGQRSMAGTT